MSTRSFDITAEAMLAAPETRWQRLWRRLRRRPALTFRPPGTVPVIIKAIGEDGSYSMIYIPAARVVKPEPVEVENDLWPRE